MKKIITHFFDCKPLTLNQAFITLRNGRRAKSSKYALFKKTIEKRLDLIELEDFGDTFDQSKHALKMTMIVYLKETCTVVCLMSEYFIVCTSVTCFFLVDSGNTSHESSVAISSLPLITCPSFKTTLTDRPTFFLY